MEATEEDRKAHTVSVLLRRDGGLAELVDLGVGELGGRGGGHAGLVITDVWRREISRKRGCGVEMVESPR